MTKKKVLFLAHDDTLIPDRRIINHAKLWQEAGWNVVLFDFTHGRHPAGERQFEGIKVVTLAFEKATEASYWYQNQTEKAFIKAIPAMTNAKSLSSALEAGDQFAKRFGSDTSVIAHLAQKLLGVERVDLRQNWDPLPFTHALIQACQAYDYDAIVANDLTTLPAAVLLKSKRPAKLVYDCHELYLEQVAFKAPMKNALYCAERDLIGSCDLVVSVSPDICTFMQDRYGLSDLPTLVRNVPQASVTAPPAKDPLRAALGLKPDKKIALFHGGFSKNRNLETLIEAFSIAKIPDTFLVFMGFGDEKLVFEAIKRFKPPRTAVLDPVNPDQVTDWIRSADMIVVPYPAVDMNTRLCMPNKLFDALQVGVPVLANANLVAVGRLLKDHHCGHLARMDTAIHFAAGLKAAFSNLNALKAGAKAVQTAFSTEKELKTLKEALTSKIWNDIKPIQNDVPLEWWPITQARQNLLLSNKTFAIEPEMLWQKAFGTDYRFIGANVDENGQIRLSPEPSLNRTVYTPSESNASLRLQQHPLAYSKQQDRVGRALALFGWMRDLYTRSVPVGLLETYLAAQHFGIPVFDGQRAFFQLAGAPYRLRETQEDATISGYGLEHMFDFDKDHYASFQTKALSEFDILTETPKRLSGLIVAPLTLQYEITGYDVFGIINNIEWPLASYRGQGEIATHLTTPLWSCPARHWRVRYVSGAAPERFVLGQVVPIFT